MHLLLFWINVWKEIFQTEEMEGIMKNRWITKATAAALAVILTAGCGSSRQTPAGSAESGASADSSADAGTGTAESDEGKTAIRIGITSSPSGIFAKFYHNDTYNGYVTYNVLKV